MPLAPLKSSNTAQKGVWTDTSFFEDSIWLNTLLLTVAFDRVKTTTNRKPPNQPTNKSTTNNNLKTPLRGGKLPPCLCELPCQAPVFLLLIAHSGHPVPLSHHPCPVPPWGTSSCIPNWTLSLQQNPMWESLTCQKQDTSECFCRVFQTMLSTCSIPTQSWVLELSLKGLGGQQGMQQSALGEMKSVCFCSTLGHLLHVKFGHLLHLKFWQEKNDLVLHFSWSFNAFLDFKRNSF